MVTRKIRNLLFTIKEDKKAAKLTWGRAFFNAEFRAVMSFRIYSLVYQNLSKGIGYILYNKSKIKYGIDIAPTSSIGPGFVIVHLGSIVIGRNVIIGDKVTVQSGVTIGMRSDKNEFMPKIKSFVYIGTGAKILGNIEIGERSIIGANAVVLNDIPDKAVCAGIPARIINADFIE